MKSRRIIHSWLVVINSGFFLVYLVLTLSATYEFSNFWLGIATFGGVGLAVLHLALRYSEGQRDLLSIDKLFIASYFYFHYGYLLPYSIGAIPYEARVFWNPAMAPQAALMVTTVLAGFLLGYNLRFKNIESESRLIFSTKPEKIHVWFFMGKLALFGGLFLILVFMFNFGIGNLISREYGFDLFYSGEFDTGLFTSGKLLLGTGAIIVASELWLRRRLTYSLIMSIGALVFYSFLAFVFFGVRSWLMIDVFLPLILSFHYLHKNISMRWGVAILLIFLIGSLVMEIARPAPERTLFAFQNELSYQLATGDYTIWDITARQYHSYTRVIQEMSLVPLEKSYQYGLTLVYGFVGSIPELGKYLIPQGYEPPERWMASIVEPWFYSNNEGIGFSMVAEAHINFGIIGGSLFVLLLGIFSGHIWLITHKNKSFGMWLMYLVFVINFIFGVRQTMMGFVRPLFGYLLIWTFVKIAELILKDNQINQQGDNKSYLIS